MSNPQKRVKPLIPCNSNDCKSTRPKLAQKSDCDVSNKLSLCKNRYCQHLQVIKIDKIFT